MESAVNRLRTGEKPSGGVMAWGMWSLAVAFVIYLFGFQTGYSIVNRNVQSDLNLTVAQIGVVAATYTWAFAICQLFSGALLDRLGARAVLVPAIAIFSLGVFVFANAENFAMLLAAQLILALGACAGFVGAGYVGGQWFGMAKFSLMFGLVQFAASLFSAFNQNLLSIAINHFDWRSLFVMTGMVGGVLFFLALLLLRDPAPMRSGHGASFFVKDVFINIGRVARVPHVWIVAAWGSVVFGAMIAAGVVWAPKLLTARGLSPEDAATSASLMWMGLAAGCIIIPKWSDVARRRKLPSVAGIALQLVALLGLLYAPSLVGALAPGLCFVFGIGAAAHMLAFSSAGDVVPPSLIGTSAAIVNGVMFLVSGILIAIPGRIVADDMLSPVTLTLMAQHAGNPAVIALAVSLLIAILMKETYPDP